MATEMARFTLRIPQALYDRLKQSADDNKRSVVKEIEYLVEQALEAKELPKAGK